METTIYQPIENYGVIGNLHTICLVAIDGSIDYLPFPRIDSPTVFLKLLDVAKGGSFCIQPHKIEFTCKQYYLTNTNILVTRFHTADGVVEITDFMPVSDKEFDCAIIRQVKAVIGQVPMHMRCQPAFNYARTGHIIKMDSEACLFVPEDDSQSPVRITTDQHLQKENDTAVSEFKLDEGDCAYFLLEADHSTQQRTQTPKEYIETVYNSTYHYWKAWSDKCNYEGLWKENVIRSALVLKLLVSQTYGSPVAAGTFGLPEAIGGNRNWDYRYTWIRDAAFTMYVFMKLGLYDEADHFIEWMQKQCKKDGLQLLYGVDGTKDLAEQELPHLGGYEGSTPVRIGNGAHNQLQIDIYGELMDTVYIFVQFARPITIEFWRQLTVQVQVVIDSWKKADHGIWEIRSGKKDFLFSRLMCWVAMDRAIKIAIKCSFPYPAVHWQEVRDDIYADIFENFWDKELESFVQYKGSKTVDASTLMMPIVGFISPYSEYWQSTIKAIEKSLVKDVLVYRYKDDDKLIDDFKGDEGTFTICSFWYVQCLAEAGEQQMAQRGFEKLLGYGNHLGLYAEQIGISGRHLGNFPQAFTHLSLISAAIEITKEKHLRKRIVPPTESHKTT